MCELLGVTANTKIKMNELFKIFFSHSEEHRNGWGLVLLDDDVFSIDKEPKKAIDSLYLKSKLKDNIETARCIAHIRKATIGEVNVNNTHPFLKNDDSGRRWVLAHNGTIFESEALSPYQYIQEGTTDSERILLYIVDEINKLYQKKHDLLNEKERIGIVEEAIKTIVPGNKLNLLIFDGDLLYVHKNEAGTLYKKELKEGMIFSTQPLDENGWLELPQNQLLVYKSGNLVHIGQKHNSSYIHSEERMKLLYLAYSEL